LENQQDRTLLWGYIQGRRSWHIYLKDGGIHKYVYKVMLVEPGEHSLYDVVEAIQLIPNKRLYPEACDFEFCKMIIRRGINLPFTTWQDNREDKQFHGEVYNVTPKSS